MNAASPLNPCSPATPLSGPPRQLPRGHARRRLWATLAQSSLCLLTLMASTSCLVTSTPDFTPPKRTAPFLVVASADPDPRGVLLVNTLEQQDPKLPFTFSADVMSEDQGANVFGHLYIDYGKGTDSPALDVITEIPPLDPSTMSDTSRRIGGKWSVEQNYVSGSCHTVTLIVSHEFDSATSCPVCRSDSSQLTWPVYVCDAILPAADCHPDFSACESQPLSQGCGAAAGPNASAKCGALP
jgi:hypothetical protein